MSSPIVAVLRRASRGQATFAELATALEAHDALWAILTGPSMAQIQAASKIPGARAPRGTIDGVTTADGRFAARLFTDGDLATAYGQGHGLADADGGVPLVTVPGAGGFVDCLVNGWDGLIIDDGTEHTLSLEQFFAFTSREKVSAKPVRSASGSPFAEWFSAAADIDGVVLDPAGPAPLALSHADLLVLGLWAEGHQPRGAELAGIVATLRGMHELTSRLAGRIIAEWPLLFVLRHGEDGGRALLCPRDRTGGAIFTSHAAAQRFIDEGACAEPAQAVPFLPVWAHSAFETMLLTYREAWVDPEPSGGGLHLDEEALLAAVEVLDERLQPRVPWFVA